MGKHELYLFCNLFVTADKEYGYKDKEKVLYNGFWRRFKMEKNFPEITGRKIVAYFNFDTV